MALINTSAATPTTTVVIDEPTSCAIVDITIPVVEPQVQQLLQEEDTSVEAPFMIIEIPLHHVAHWLMLWSQSHFLGEAAAAASVAATMNTVAPEIALVMLGIVFIAMGILSSAFVVATEFRQLHCLVISSHSALHEAQTSAVRRWCMVLAGTTSLMFSVLQLASFALLSEGSYGSIGAATVFRVTGVLWGVVSGYLWCTMASREESRMHAAIKASVGQFAALSVI